MSCGEVNGVRVRVPAADCTVCVTKSPWGFLAFFPKLLGIFSPSFTHLIHVPIYGRLQIFFIQLPIILTKLCHIMRDHPAHIICSKCPPSAETHAGIFWHFPQTVGNLIFLIQILHIYYTFLSTVDCKILSDYLQLWRSYAILSATTQLAFQPMADILSTLWWSRLT